MSSKLGVGVDSIRVSGVLIPVLHWQQDAWLCRFLTCRYMSPQAGSRGRSPGLCAPDCSQARPDLNLAALCWLGHLLPHGSCCQETRDDASLCCCLFLPPQITHLPCSVSCERSAGSLRKPRLLNTSTCLTLSGCDCASLPNSCLTEDVEPKTRQCSTVSWK